VGGRVERECVRVRVRRLVLPFPERKECGSDVCADPGEAVAPTARPICDSLPVVSHFAECCALTTNSQFHFERE